MVLRPSSSPSRLYGTEDFKTAWDNDIRFHVARNLVYLRRCRELSQKSVAGGARTSQSAIARIESGQENLTVDTLQRIVRALDGRFFISIHPNEHYFETPAHWWIAAGMEDQPWTYHGMITGNDGERELAVLGLSRPFASDGNNMNAEMLSIQPDGTTSQPTT
ncbi:MAG: helix-turn-helix transcriptional regulator [Acidobacteriota bacterium]